MGDQLRAPRKPAYITGVQYTSWMRGIQEAYCTEGYKRCPQLDPNTDAQSSNRAKENIFSLTICDDKKAVTKKWVKNSWCSVTRIVSSEWFINSFINPPLRFRNQVPTFAVRETASLGQHMLIIIYIRMLHWATSFKWEPQNSTKTIQLKLNSTKTLKPGFAKYDVDANLFRLGSTNPKKKFPAPGCCFLLELF